MSVIMNELRGEHRDIGTLVRLLEAQMVRFEAGESLDFDLVGDILGYVQEYPDRFHHPKEDLIFARLVRRDAATAAEVEALHAEHRRMAALTRDLASFIAQIALQQQVPRADVVGRLRSYAGLLRQHMQHEEAGLFPLAEARLTAEDWRDLDRRITGESDPVFGSGEQERYKALRRRITREIP